ncbi:hypothetical protein ACFLTH_16015 [Bacteroidota bacterium]
MTSGQSWMAIGAMVILSYLSLTFNRSQNVQLSSSLTYEAVITSTGIGQSLLEQIAGLSFDEFTVNGNTSDPDSLTSYFSLGPEGGEDDVTLFDDIDDFNGFVKYDTLSRLGVFESKVDVYYVNKSDLDYDVMTKTFIKRIDITVINTFLARISDQEVEMYKPDTLYFNQVMTY